MFDKYKKIFSIQTFIIILIVLTLSNIGILYLQSSVALDIVNIKQDHLKSNNEICSSLVRRYERRALDLAYRNLSIDDFKDTITKDTKDIPVENIVYVKLKDETIIPVGYFDEKGFLQTLIISKL